MKNTSIVRRTTVGFAVVAALAATVSVAFAHSSSKNGATMSHSHSTVYINPLDKEMRSFSSAQTPRGVIESIFADSRLKDRCRNANGSWQSWVQFAYGNKSASWAYSSGTAYARGTYQNCVYGHEYWNQSLHQYRDSGFGLDEYHWQDSYN